MLVDEPEEIMVHMFLGDSAHMIQSTHFMEETFLGLDYDGLSTLSSHDIDAILLLVYSKQAW